MTYADFVIAVPSVVRLLLTVIVFVGLSILISWVFYGKSVQLAQEPKKDEDDTSPHIPASYYLGGRIMQVVSIGFIFLMGFTIAQFWVTHRSADEANSLNGMSFSRAFGSAASLPAEAGREQILEGLSNYRVTMIEKVWPLMQQADVEAAASAQADAVIPLNQAMLDAAKSGATEQLTWETLTTSVDDMMTSGTEMLATVPGPGVEAMILLVFFMGLMNIIATAVLQPARLPFYLTMIGVMAGVTSVLIFVVIEVSNPFVGGAGLIPILDNFPIR